MAILCAILGGISLAICQLLIWVYAPVEAAMGLPQKIFYAHLPLAWWALASFLVLFVASIVWLWRKNDWWDELGRAATEIGVLFCGMALLTGMIWAKKSWGTWWTWDPRLTATLIMWFIYSGCLALRRLDMPPRRKKTVCAVVGVAAFLDVPLVFFSARLLRSIHPAVFASGEGGMEPEMKLVALACVAAMGIFWAALLRVRQAQLRQDELLGNRLFGNNGF